jgi:hypothetical protein
MNAPRIEEREGLTKNIDSQNQGKFIVEIVWELAQILMISV